jgi:hypothetical protein
VPSHAFRTVTAGESRLKECSFPLTVAAPRGIFTHFA